MQKSTNSLLPTLKLKLKTEKLDGSTYSTSQQIMKFKVNPGTKQEIWGVNIDFQSIHSKWSIDAILQHMGFYATTENRCVMMRENQYTII